MYTALNVLASFFLARVHRTACMYARVYLCMHVYLSPQCMHARSVSGRRETSTLWRTGKNLI